MIHHPALLAHAVPAAHPHRHPPGQGPLAPPQPPRRHRLAHTLAALVALVGIPATATPEAATPRPPNLIVLLADDLGWRDLGCAGHEQLRTPNIDRLAREGMFFTQAHAAAPICSPSRAALLTGQSPARLNYEFVPKFAAGRQTDAHPLQSPDFPTELPAGTPTVASALRSAGYTTAFCGKWHLNRHQGHYLGWRPGSSPSNFGFDHCIDDFGAHPYGYPKGKRPPAVAPDTFPTDSLTDGAIGFIRQPHDRPFLLWLSYYQVHDPFHSRCADRVAWHQARLPAGAHPARAHYAAMVETLDHEVGRLLKALDESGKANDTLLVFTSDNGGHPAVSANGPLRGSKWNLYQGGIRVPLIVRWPGKVAPASRSDALVIGMDLPATLMAAAGLPAPWARDGTPFLPALTGTPAPATRTLTWHFPFYQPETDFAKALAKTGVNDFAVAQSRPQAAIRSGPLKLIHFFESNQSELYNLLDDPSELNDLSASSPDEAAALRKELLETLAAQSARLPVRKPPTQPAR